MFKVIDNFLPKEQFLELQYTYLSNKKFPYYYQDGKDYPVSDKQSKNLLDQYQFTHLFFDNLKENSEWYGTLKYILPKLKVSFTYKSKS